MPRALEVLQHAASVVRGWRIPSATAERRARFPLETSTVLAAMCWSVALTLAGVTTARFVAFDANRLFLIANALAYWIYLPIYIVLAIAIACRRYALAALSALLVAVHVVAVFPSLEGPHTPKAAFREPRLTLFSANVLFDNPEPKGIASEILKADPDIVLLQEFSQHWQRALRDSAVWDRYPHRIIVRPADVTGFAILSRLPLRDGHTSIIHAAPEVLVRVTVAGRDLQIAGVHPSAPIFSFHRWEDQRNGITRSIERLTGRVVLAGDFNVTQFNQWISEIEDLGFLSAFESLGRGTATTWPNGTRPFPSIRLDHVFVSGRLVPLAIREGSGQGSDHRPVVTTIAVT